MFTFGLITGSQSFDPLVLLLVAMALEGIAGSARFILRPLPSPLSPIVGMIRFFERKLNRDKRSQLDRAIRGIIVTIFILGLCFGLSLGVVWITWNINYGWALEVFLTASLLSQRLAYDQARGVAKALNRNDLNEARQRMAKITNQDTTAHDEHTVCRTAIELCADTFTIGVVAPVFWYVLFGFPGLFIYRALNAMTDEIGHPTEQHRAFGFATARLDDALSFIPTRLAGLFLAIAALFAPTANPSQALKIMWRDAGNHHSLTAGWPEAAMAGALNITLAGPRPGNNNTAAAWIGEGTAKATTRDIGRALYVFGVACLINLIWVAAIAMIRYSLPG